MVSYREERQRFDAMVLYYGCHCFSFASRHHHEHVASFDVNFFHLKSETFSKVMITTKNQEYPMAYDIMIG